MKDPRYEGWGAVYDVYFSSKVKTTGKREKEFERHDLIGTCHLMLEVWSCSYMISTRDRPVNSV